MSRHSSELRVPSPLCTSFLYYKKGRFSPVPQPGICDAVCCEYRPAPARCPYLWFKLKCISIGCNEMRAKKINVEWLVCHGAMSSACTSDSGRGLGEHQGPAAGAVPARSSCRARICSRTRTPSSAQTVSDPMVSGVQDIDRFLSARCVASKMPTPIDRQGSGMT
jgi:hypothetical protein